jgi:putative transposase
MIDAHKGNLSIATACKALEVSDRGYRKWKKREPKQFDPLLRKEIHAIKEKHSLYGYRRVTHQLKRKGHKVNHKTVLKMMRQEKLIVVKKRFKPKTTHSNHNLKRYPNLLLDFEPKAINQVWVTDITYIYIGNKFAYLALVMDRYSRRIVGWELSWNVDTQLTLSALHRAVALRGVENIKGCIHHSDHGVQYLSASYINKLNDLGMLPSMGEVGNSYDNAHAESLNKTIKYEEVYPNEYETFEEAYNAIKKYVEVYNEDRLHSKIGYKPPIEFEQILNMGEYC